ncbi:redoxin family protein [Nocardioides sp. InS609-2]|uniref:redoxin family protein n=1 Tax=Nocardioides sp. InS609-2 TaxID=2760705 RepID=UPI0017BB62D8|nr:redoxin family protein [Nocardioides sp. InS609-2]MBA3781201.1 redoxin family protein [Nocardioides sp.]
MRLKIAAGLLLAAVLALSGCAASGSNTESGARSGASAVSLKFTGEDIDGAPYDGKQLADKPTVLWFWAPWCPTCRAQAGGVETLAKKYAGQVNVVGVGGLADAADIRDFARQVDGPIHLIDEEGEIWRHFNVTAQSTYVVLDADGVVVSEGYLDDAALADQVAELVG